jgi:hypothetical protein
MAQEGQEKREPNSTECKGKTHTSTLLFRGTRKPSFKVEYQGKKLTNSKPYRKNTFEEITARASAEVLRLLRLVADVEKKAMDPQRRHFTEEEVKAKGGTHVRALVGAYEVPQGKTGVVIDAMPAGDGYDVCVEWESDGDSVLQDWFTKDEYERFLEEVE